MRLILRIVPVILAALGGAFMVFSSYDDSPGGSLLGLVMILVAVFLSIQKRAPAK